MAYNIEVFELIACNDDRIVLTMPFNMTDLRGIGMPNVRLNTIRSPLQNGSTFHNIYLRDRLLTLTIDTQGCNRDALWSLRQDLIELMYQRQSFRLRALDPVWFGDAHFETWADSAPRLW